MCVHRAAVIKQVTIKRVAIKEDLEEDKYHCYVSFVVKSIMCSVTQRVKKLFTRAHSNVTVGLNS